MFRSVRYVLATTVAMTAVAAPAAPPAQPVAPTAVKPVPAFADRTVDSVRAAQAEEASALASTRPAPPQTGRSRCIGVDHVAGAVVFGDRAVELTMTDGSRWRMSFAKECPALSFYRGFYYRRAVAGRLCAGRDAVISRTGGECPIAAITRVSAAKTAKRTRPAKATRHH